MDYKEIQDLIKLVKKNQISELEIERKDFKIQIKSQGDDPIIQQVSMPAQPQLQQPMQQFSQPNVQPQHSQPDSSAETETEPSHLIEMKSSMIGTFYRAPGPDKDPYVGIGDSIKQGEVICMIEAMKLFNEIESEISGKIVKILVEDATPVEFDQPLFLVDPKA